MKLACEKTQTQDDPISHIIVLIGDAKNPNGRETIIKPVYNCEEVTVPNGNTKSSPFNLLITNNPPPTNVITNINKTLVINA